jgi:hypothetical protein
LPILSLWWKFRVLHRRRARRGPRTLWGPDPVITLRQVLCGVAAPLWRRVLHSSGLLSLVQSILFWVFCRHGVIVSFWRSLSLEVERRRALYSTRFGFLLPPWVVWRDRVDDPIQPVLHCVVTRVDAPNPTGWVLVLVFLFFLPITSQGCSLVFFSCYINATRIILCVSFQKKSLSLNIWKLLAKYFHKGIHILVFYKNKKLKMYFEDHAAILKDFIYQTG